MVKCIYNQYVIGLKQSENMKKLHLPYVKLPGEFITLLKSNLAVTSSPTPIFDIIRQNMALYHTLENSFQEFDDGRGVEKLLTALGWANFRDRMASLYVFKSIYGDFPQKTNMELVEDIKGLESRFMNHGVHGYSRLFLLGFYLKLANIKIQRKEDNQFLEIRIPDNVLNVLKLSPGKAEKIDWLILIITHLMNSLEEKVLINLLISGKKFEEIYELLPKEARSNMHENLLAYGASINEPDFFLYEKV